MTVIVALKDLENREEFLSNIAAFNIEVTHYKSLKKLFLLEDCSLAEFPLKNKAYIKSISAGEDEVTLTGEVVNLTVDASTYPMGGSSYSLSRVCRRKPHFDKRYPPKTYSTSYEAARDGTGVDIYILDSGFDPSHSEFVGHSFNLDGSTTLQWSTYHGSYVALCAGAKNYGPATGAILWNAKVDTLDVAGYTSKADDILTHYLARSGTNRPAVVNLSFGGLIPTPTLSVAVTELIDNGIVNTTGAGNNRSDLDALNFYPAEDDPDNIIVGGITYVDTPYYEYSFGTNYGTVVDILAPAQTIVGFSPNGITYASGTSFAAPMVAGVIACMLQGYQRLTTRTEVQAVKTKLLANATTGELVLPANYDNNVLPDRIVYLDPSLPFETIQGLTPL